MFDKWRERRRKKREEEEEVSEIIGAGKTAEEHGQIGKDEEISAEAWIIASRGRGQIPPG